jgi:hypothetical protein
VGLATGTVALVTSQMPPPAKASTATTITNRDRDPGPRN